MTGGPGLLPREEGLGKAGKNAWHRGKAASCCPASAPGLRPWPPSATPTSTRVSLGSAKMTQWSRQTAVMRQLQARLSCKH